MVLEIVIERSRDSIRAAIGDFAARHGYRLHRSWFGGTLIKKPRSGFPSAKVRVTSLERQRGATIVRLNLADRQKFWDLAYELRAFLLDERAYDRDRPTRCPTCGRPIANLSAQFCGSCGIELTANAES